MEPAMGNKIFDQLHILLLGFVLEFLAIYLFLRLNESEATLVREKKKS